MRKCVAVCTVIVVFFSGEGGTQPGPSVQVLHRRVSSFIDSVG